jgi:hypothetical protein
MGTVIAAVCVRTELPPAGEQIKAVPGTQPDSSGTQTEAQREAVRAGCREYLRLTQGGEGPDERAVEEFWRRAMEAPHSACWVFAFRYHTEEDAVGSDKLVAAMDRHCSPAGMLVSRHFCD